MRIILDLDTSKIYTEKDTRRLLLKEELQDIDTNAIDYISKEMDIDAQIRCIKFAIEESIEKVIQRLNACWNYNIKLFEEVKENKNNE